MFRVFPEAGHNRRPLHGHRKASRAAHLCTFDESQDHRIVGPVPAWFGRTFQFQGGQDRFRSAQVRDTRSAKPFSPSTMLTCCSWPPSPRLPVPGGASASGHVLFAPWRSSTFGDSRLPCDSLPLSLSAEEPEPQPADDTPGLHNAQCHNNCDHGERKTASSAANIPRLFGNSPAVRRPCTSLATVSARPLRYDARVNSFSERVAAREQPQRSGRSLSGPLSERRQLTDR